MKYTSEKILDFTSLVYTSEQDKAGLGYKAALHNWEVAKKSHRLVHTISYGLPIIGIVAAVVYFSLTARFLFDGFPNFFEMLSVALNSFLFFCSVKLLWLTHSNRKQNNKNWMEYADKLEPRQIWHLEYPHDKGARAKLIRSILGARLINLTLIDRTAIPMDKNVVDARVSHLITEIAKSTDEDIHSYLVEETTSFCRQAVKDINFYSPIISLQDWVKEQA